MCGICGQYTYAPHPPDRALWGALTDRMWRRGPDGRGTWDDGAHCLLGCRRLAVMDPTPAGRLPMRGPGGHVLAFNGELYNFVELAAQLRARGHRFASRGDSEVVLAALAEWGEGALDRFNGMFALAFYDPRARTLLLARDHAGIKPLYWMEHREGVAFASEYTQLLAHPWSTGRRRSREAVEMYLRLGYIPAPLGLLEGTGMLEPGCWIRFGPGGRPARGRYFSFPPGAVESGGRAGLDAVDEAVERAVRRQVVSDVPVGAFLSGGVDSPLVAACMTEACAGPVHTFSIGVDDPALDESADALRYAARLGTRHHQRTVTAHAALELLDEVLDASREPMADEGMFPALAVSRLARERVTVALSGEGGDELFWGYVQRQCPALMQDGGGTPPGERYLAWFAEFGREQFRACFPGTAWWPSHPFYAWDAAGPTEHAHALRRTEWEAYLPFILLKADRASMYHSLELRVPLLDREVVSAAAALAPADCLDLSSGVGKLPLRRALERRVGWRSPGKRGFTVPMNEWVRGPLREPVARSLRSLRGLDELEVDPRALAALFARHLEGSEDNGMALWRIFFLDRWTERHCTAPRLGALEAA